MRWRSLKEATHAVTLQLTQRRLHAVNRPLQGDIGIKHQRKAYMADSYHDRIGA